MTWLLALICVLRAAANKGQNQYYISYNKESTDQFMKNCRWWASNLQLFCNERSESVYDGEKDLLVYKMTFSSGFVIEALSSNPNNIRGKGGDVVVDEAAFIEQLDEIVRAITALVLWSPERSIVLVSTADTVDNPFHQYCEKAKKGEKGMAYYQMGFKEAIEKGLYRRICFLSGQKWSKESERSWEQGIRDLYAPFGDAELDCIPLDYSQNGLFKAEDFVLMSWEEFAKIESAIHDEAIAFDLATTGRDMGDRQKGRDPFYTFGVHMMRHKKIYIIADIIYAQVNVEDGDEMIMNWVKEKKVKKLVLEQEPTSRFISSMRKRLKGTCKVIGSRPVGDKVLRAKPFLNETVLGNVAILPFKDRRKLISLFCRWPPPQPLPLISDSVDATVHAYNSIALKPVQIPVGSR
ncbi:MAG: hypothetical protein F6J98_01680 [Moorea sp. SIO4G2]|nr:hypothetical protein [Moorena sp. SIO4G2]